MLCGAEAAVEDGVTHRRRLGIAVARAGQPPTPDLRGTRGLADVDDAVALIVLRIAGREVRGAPAQVDVGAVHEPEVMDTAGVRPRGIEEGDGARAPGVADVEDLEPRRLEADPGRLVGDDEEVAGEIQRVRAHVGVRQVGLEDDRGLGGLRHVDGGDVLRRGLVGQPQHAPAVARELDHHALAHVAEAAEVGVGEQPHVAGGVCSRHGRIPAGHPTTSAPGANSHYTRSTAGRPNIPYGRTNSTAMSTR